MTNPNPGDFNNKVGYDLYLNPWWALEFQGLSGRRICSSMTELLGPPDLWFQGIFHKLLWGPRHVHELWRPSIHASLSGGNGKVWFHLWLPWRAYALQSGKYSGKPMGGNILDRDVSKSDFGNLRIHQKACKSEERLMKTEWLYTSNSLVVTSPRKQLHEEDRRWQNINIP